MSGRFRNLLEGSDYTTRVTQRLYYHDAYLADFDATVVDRADGGRRVYLNRAAFYPSFRGPARRHRPRLGEAEVVDVVDEGERIAHLLARPVAGREACATRCELGAPLRPHAAAPRASASLSAVHHPDKL